jgi:hypothetical protein
MIAYVRLAAHVAHHDRAIQIDHAAQRLAQRLLAVPLDELCQRQFPPVGMFHLSAPCHLMSGRDAHRVAGNLPRVGPHTDHDDSPGNPGPLSTQAVRLSQRIAPPSTDRICP